MCLVSDSCGLMRACVQANEREGESDKESLLSSSPGTQRLSLATKLAFGAGASPAALTNTVIGFFFAAYLLEVATV